MSQPNAASDPSREGAAASYEGAGHEPAWEPPSSDSGSSPHNGTAPEFGSSPEYAASAHNGAEVPYPPLATDAYGPWLPEEPPKPPRRVGLTIVQAVCAFIAVAALGWPLGVLWQAVAPNVPVLVVQDGAIYNDPQPEQFMGGDAWFAVLGLLFGVVVAVLVWITCRQLRGPLGILVLAVASVAAAVIAWKVGREIGLSEYLAGLHSAPEGTHLSKPNDIRVAQFQWWPPKLSGVLLVPALGATITMTIMAAWSSFSTLRKPYSQSESGFEPGF